MLLTAGLAWLTWGAVAAVAVGVGLLLPAEAAAGSVKRLRIAMWMGAASIVAITMAWNLALANGGSSGVVLLILLTALGILGWWRGGSRIHIDRPAPAALLFLCCLLAASLLMAVLALGTPLNYDAGLYHLGSINYASEFGTVPGLANLHDRFGFNSSVYPLSALLGNGPWSGQGFRMLIGSFLTLMALDSAARLVERPRSERLSAGSLVMIGGTGIVWSFVLLVSQDRLVSPTPDALSMILVVVATAYLTDALLRTDSGPPPEVAVALVVAALSATARPLNWSFWLATVLVVGTLVTWRMWRPDVRVGIALSIVLGVIMMIRDAVLSGWLLFPLGLLPVPVPWRTIRPDESAEWIRLWARYRSGSATDAPLGGDWFLPWLGRTARDWSIAITFVMLLAWLVLFLMNRRGSRQYWAMIPSAFALLLWFSNAPDPRFAWGQILAMGLVPLAIVLEPLARLSRLVVVGLSGLIVVSMAGAFVRHAPQNVVQEAKGWTWRMGPLSVPLAAVPVREVAVRASTLSDGTAVTVPTDTDQCWNTFPLCRPSAGGPDIRLRGSGIADGFELVSR